MKRGSAWMMRVLAVTVASWAIAVSGLHADSAEKANPFWGDGKTFFEVQEIAQGKGVRFPSIVVAMDGTVIAFRCANGPITLRRSEDGGATWGPEMATSGETYKALGAAVVDENSGDVLVFPDHIQPAFTLYRSSNHGKTWAAEEVIKRPDGFEGIGNTHGGEHGITLRYGSKKGRLLIPARVFGPKNSNALEWRPYCYNSAMYSDDGGKTWQTTAPFPELGTGEGTLAELSNGHIYYNSRNHMAPNTMRRTAWSYDGGEIWSNLQISDVLPDGPQDSAYGCKGGLARLPLDDRDILVYSNLDSPSGRRRATVWASFDGAKTWPVKRLVYEGPSAYSSLNAGRTGTPSEGMIYLLVEGSREHVYGGVQIARFNLPWILGGEPTGDGEAPDWETASSKRPARPGGKGGI